MPPKMAHAYRGSGYLVLLTLLFIGCQSGADKQAKSSATEECQEVATLESATDLFIRANERRYYEALAKARSWLDKLTVDPMQLRREKILGMKKLTEQLGAYYQLWRVTEANQRPAIKERVNQVARVTQDPAYHHLDKVSDELFKQESMSYLRAALLMDRFELDTSNYRKRIQALKPRLDGHLKDRGPHQRETFHWYYAHFGLEPPFKLVGSWQQGLIRSQIPVPLIKLDDAYQITHEVFAVFRFADDLEATPFAAKDLQYLRATLHQLMQRYMAALDADIVAELITCIFLARLTDMPIYQRGLVSLLSWQNSDGSWGSYVEEGKKHGTYIRRLFQLHTTGVVLEALTLSFDIGKQQSRRSVLANQCS